MTTSYECKIGLFKGSHFVPCRTTKVTYGYGRFQIPVEAAEAIGLKAGDKYSIRPTENDREVCIYKSTNGKSKFLSNPTSINFADTYTLDFNATYCKIAAQDLPLTNIVFFLDDKKLVGKLPDVVQRSANQIFSKRRIKEPRVPVDWRELVAGYTGAAAALALDAHRYASKEQPTNIEQMLDMLRDEGHRVSSINSRLWSLDGKTATTADLSDLAQKYHNGLVLVAA